MASINSVRRCAAHVDNPWSFMMDTSRLKITMDDQPSKGYTGTTAFANIEALLGVKPPPDYVEFIRRCDGGCPEVCCFRPQGDTDPKNYFGIDWFYSVDDERGESIIDAIVGWRDVLGLDALPVARDGGD